MIALLPLNASRMTRRDSTFLLHLKLMNSLLDALHCNHRFQAVLFVLPPPLILWNIIKNTFEVVNIQPRGTGVSACEVSTSHYVQRLCQSRLKSNRCSVASPSLSEEHCALLRKRPGDNLTDLTWCYPGVDVSLMNIHFVCAFHVFQLL